jgi:hypothetical protein
MKRIIIFFVIGFMSTLGMAQNTAFEKLPGFVDIGQILDLQEGELTTEIEIKNPLLSLVANMSEAEDSDLAKLLRGLELIKVYKFQSNESKMDNIKQKLENLDLQLKKNKWDQFVKIREKDQYSNIYMMSGDSTINGLTVFTIDGNETVLINIVGDIDLSSIGKMGKKFNIPELDTLEMKN